MMWQGRARDSARRGHAFASLAPPLSCQFSSQNPTANPRPSIFLCILLCFSVLDRVESNLLHCTVYSETKGPGTLSDFCFRLVSYFWSWIVDEDRVADFNPISFYWPQGSFLIISSLAPSPRNYLNDLPCFRDGPHDGKKKKTRQKNTKKKKKKKKKKKNQKKKGGRLGARGAFALPGRPKRGKKPSPFPPTAQTFPGEQKRNGLRAGNEKKGKQKE